MTKIKIIGLDHIVLNVNNIDRSLKFYTEVLGLKGERVEEFRSGKVGFPSVRINAGTIIDLFPRKDGVDKSIVDKADGNLNHFCLVVDKENFTAVRDELQLHKIAIREGPVSRWGAQGQATSVYFLDLDGNEIEIRSY
jgi:catechol 2,3-dioxygenase-like lactoylglutathione lyase family enzyme